MADGTVAVLDSKDQHGPVLTYRAAAWDAFLAAAKTGDFVSGA